MRWHWKIGGLFVALAIVPSLGNGQAYAATPVFLQTLPTLSYSPLKPIHYRRAGVMHRNPWQAPYHVSHYYRGGPGARMGLVAQGIIPPPQHSYYSYPGFYWNNYFYYPNYRMIYDF
jgi:hypothetical protein